jgi:hypothetical protein
MFQFEAPFPAPVTTSVLPNPEFSNPESLTDSVDPRRAMDGTLRTYIKRKDRCKMQWTFSLTRNKALEIYAFLVSYFASDIRVTDHENRVWIGNFTNNPFEFTGDRKAGPAVQNWPVGETYTTTLEFEGVEQI